MKRAFFVAAALAGVLAGCSFEATSRRPVYYAYSYDYPASGYYYTSAPTWKDYRDYRGILHPYPESDYYAP